MKHRSPASARKTISALFVANGFAFGVWSAHMVALIFGASVGYLGFLVGPPVVGSLSGVLRLRAALALVVVAGVVISFAARSVMAETA